MLFKKILVLAALIPGLAGCVASVDDGSYYGEHGRYQGSRGRYSEVHPDHVHGAGCGHIFRGGVWVVAY